MRTAVTLAALLAFACAPFILSQSPSQHANPPAARAPQTASPSWAPMLSEEENLKIENLQLRMTLLRDQENQINQQFAALIEQIEKEHPGYVWSPQANGLVRSPQPEKAAKH